MTWPDQGAPPRAATGRASASAPSAASTSASARPCPPTTSCSRTSRGSSDRTAASCARARPTSSSPTRTRASWPSRSRAARSRRDSLGRWWAGNRQLDRPPFEQAADSHHSLVAKLRELPDWPAGLDPIVGHAVAFPNVEVASLGTKVFDLGMSADPDLILDKAILDPEGPRNQRIRDWVDRLLRAVGGRGRSGRPGRRASSSCQATITSPLELRIAAPVRDRRREPRDRPRDGRAALPPQHVAWRAAGGGRRWGRDRQDDAGHGQGAAARDGGLRDPARLLQLAARAGARATRPATSRTRTGHLHVSTFHQLAEDLGREAGTLPAEAGAGDRRVVRGDAAGRRSTRRSGQLGPRYHAIVVDEGAGLRRRLAGVARGAALRREARTSSTSSTIRRSRSSVPTRSGSWA